MLRSFIYLQYSNKIPRGKVAEMIYFYVCQYLGIGTVVCL